MTAHPLVWSRRRRAVVLAFAASAFASVVHAEQTVQIDVSAVLNARVVTTFTAGKLVTWTQAIDTGHSGEATAGAAAAMGNATVKALPIDGRFPADAVRPEIVLNFSDEQGTAPQVRRSPQGDAYSFEVPSGRYSRLILAFMCSGETDLEVQLSYDDTFEKRAVHVGDWYNPLPAANPLRFNIADDLGKWNSMNHLMEANRHFVHGFDVQPAHERTLRRVTIAKPTSGVLTFWGATGVATALDAGSSGGGGGGTASGGSNAGGASAGSGGVNRGTSGTGGDPLPGFAGAGMGGSAPAVAGRGSAGSGLGGDLATLQGTPSAVTGGAGSVEQPSAMSEAGCGMAGSRSDFGGWYVAGAAAFVVRARRKARRSQRPVSPISVP